MKKIFLLLMAVYYCLIIFSFSSQTATVSDGKSKGTIAFVYEKVMVPLFDCEPLQKDMFVEKINGKIRKLAHFANFFILAVFVYAYTKEYDDDLLVKVLTAFLVCVIIASFDEYHQSFFPGRAPSVKDVVIDLTGAMTGFLFSDIFGILRMISSRA